MIISLQGKMRILLLFLLLVSINLQGYSQGIKPQNIYRVTVTSRYIVENGERTSEFYAVNQEISDSLGRMHTEIDYDWETRYPHNYRWHYFDSILHVRTDFFKNENIERREIYQYSQDGYVTSELHFEFQDGDSLLIREIHYNYNSSGSFQVVAFNNSGKRLYRLKSKFDENGTEISRRVRGRGIPADNIRRLDRQAHYNSLGLLVSEKVQLRMTDRTRNEYTRQYEYDDQGNITGLLELDKSGNQAYRIEYVWQQNRNRVTRILHYDSHDKLEMFLAKRYEIYTTSDRRHRVIDY
jgi:hypothetical protein